MKILHVTYIYPPILNVADGITNVVYNVTRELTRRGHNVTVYASNLLDLHNRKISGAAHLTVNGVKIYYSRSLWNYKTFIVTPSIIPLLYNNIDGFDVMHIHDCRSFQGISAYLIARERSIPYIFQPHGSFFSSYLESSRIKVAKITLDKIVSNKIVKNASKIIVLNQTEAQLYSNMDISKENIVILPNGIDLSEYANLPIKGSFKIKHGISDNKKIILYIGRINKTKGLSLLIKAYASLVNKMKVKNSLLIIAGPDDGYLNELRYESNSLKISESVLFTGFISPEEKMMAFVDADVFVTPFFNGFPITFLEACVAGTPIITTTLGDQLSWINENTGYVTLPTYEYLAQALYTILSDHELRQKFSNNCRKVVKSQFSLDKVVDRLEHLYENIIN